MMDSADRALFERSIRGATARHTGAALDDALRELGWHDALAADERDAVAILFEQQGASTAASSALEAVVGGALLPAFGQGRPPGAVDGGRVLVDGLALAPRDRLLVVTDSDAAFVVDASSLDVRRVHGVDPSLGLLRVRGAVDPTDPQAFDWSSAVARGRRALAHELVGVSRTMLALARAHALERVQFGRPIAMFQAVRHRLAETLVAIETADAALDAAWQDGSPVTAAMAKSLAGRGARTAARHCQQVLAGIGFTTEHPLHRSIRRALVLDQLLGSSKLLTKELGEALLASRQLPPLLPL
jgi:hypothetical protein